MRVRGNPTDTSENIGGSTEVKQISKKGVVGRHIPAMVNSSRFDRDQVTLSPHALWRRPQAPPERVTAAMRSPKLHCCVDGPLPSAIPQVAEPEGPVVYLQQVPIPVPGGVAGNTSPRFGDRGTTLLGLEYRRPSVEDCCLRGMTPKVPKRTTCAGERSEFSAILLRSFRPVHLHGAFFMSVLLTGPD